MKRTLVLVVMLFALAACGRAVKQALKDVASPDAKVRAAAAETLGSAKAPEAVTPLIALVKDKELDVRRAAVRALGKIGRPEAVEPLLGVAGKKELADDADAALKSIGAAGEPALLAALKKKPPSIHAIRALGAIKSEKAIDPLLAMAFDPQEKDGGEARKALGSIGGARVTRIATERAASPDATTRKFAYETLGALKDRDAVPMLIEKLGEADHQVAAAAAGALGDIGDARAIEPLFARMNVKVKENDALQEAAGRALGSFGEAVAPRLVAALDGPDEFVRAAAAAGLGATKDASAIAPLVRHLGDSDNVNSSLNSSMGLALAHIGSSAMPAILDAAKSTNDKVRSAAVIALGNVKDDRALPALLEMLHDKKSDVRSIAGWLVTFTNDPRADRFLADALKVKDLDVVQAAVPYYVTRGIEGSEPTLIEALNRELKPDETLDLTAATLFVNSGNPKLEQAARAWAERHDFSVQHEKEASTKLGWGALR